MHSALARRIAPIVGGVVTASACAGPGGAPPRTAPPRAFALPPAPAGLAQSAGPVAVLGPEASRVTFERMARFPDPGWQVPRSVAFAPGDRELTYLQTDPSPQASSETMA